MRSLVCFSRVTVLVELGVSLVVCYNQAGVREQPCWLAKPEFEDGGKGVSLNVARLREHAVDAGAMFARVGGPAVVLIQNVRFREGELPAYGGWLSAHLLEVLCSQTGALSQGLAQELSLVQHFVRVE